MIQDVHTLYIFITLHMRKTHNYKQMKNPVDSKGAYRDGVKREETSQG